MDENNKPVQPQSAEPVQTPTSAPAPAPTQPVTPASAPVTGVKKNKTQLLVGGIIAVLLLAGGIAYGVYAYITNQPDYLLTKSIEQLGQESAVAAKFKVTSGTESSGVIFSGDIAARADKGSKNGEAVIGVGTGDARVTVTARAFEETLYLRFGSLGNFGNLMKTMSPSQAAVYDTPEFKAALSRVDNKWFSLNKEELAGVAQSTAQSGSFNGFKADEYQKMLDIYNKHPFFKADKSLADEVIEGTNSAHFTIRIDKPAYKAFLTELKAANLESIKVTDSDIQNADKDADDFAKQAAVDIWVARDTKKLKQVKFAGIEKGSEGSMTLTFITQLPTFEKLEKPADAMPFSEFMTTLLGPIYSTPTTEDGFDL